MVTDAKKEATPPEAPAPVTSIVKPSNDPLLEKLKSKRPPTIAGVDTNSESYPLLRMVEANDYLRLHPGEEYYWSSELCFVKVPIKGQNKDLLHCIDEDIAVQTCRAERSFVSASHWQPSRTMCSSSVSCLRRTSTIPGTRAF
jgi:hypothetical protein